MGKDWITTRVNGCQPKSTAVHVSPGKTKIQIDSSDLARPLITWFTGVNITIQVWKNRSFCGKWFEKSRAGKIIFFLIIIFANMWPDYAASKVS